MKSKMEWEKTSKKMIDLFDLVLPKYSKVERKIMFWYSVRFTNLNMFMGLHSDGIILRLGEEERESFIRKYNAKIFEPMPRRRMREYVVVLENLLADITFPKT